MYTKSDKNPCNENVLDLTSGLESFTDFVPIIFRNGKNDQNNLFCKVSIALCLKHVLKMFSVAGSKLQRFVKNCNVQSVHRINRFNDLEKNHYFFIIQFKR